MFALKLVMFIVNNAATITAEVEELIQFVQDMIDRWNQQDGDTVPAPVGSPEMDQQFLQDYPLLSRTASANADGLTFGGLTSLKMIAQWIKDNPQAAIALLQLLKLMFGKA